MTVDTNTVLYGHAATPRLIAFEVEGPNQVRVFANDKDGRVTSALSPFTPFLLVADTGLLRNFPGTAEIEALRGDGFFRYLVRVPALPDLTTLREYLQRVSGKTPTAPDAPYFYLSDPIQQFLLLSGQTHFLGMHFQELKRLQIDIEVYCSAGFEFPNPARAEDRIIAIALSDSTGWETVLSGAAMTEADLLRAMVRCIRERDPDVLEGHNLFRFDLEYIEARATRHGVALPLGRDGSPLSGHPSRMQIAERTITYRKYELCGRHIVDTWILAQHYDVGARDLESYGLKDVARHFDLAAEDRTVIPPERISWHFDHDPERLMQYALDDVRETRAIAALLSPSYFVQAQIFPFSYQNVILRGNATKIDALLIREYLRQRQAIPACSAGTEVLGGYTDIRYRGVASHILHCDVTSLYPSIMLHYRCFPAKDTLGIFPQLLHDLRTFRLDAKRRARDATKEEDRVTFEALQSTFKILINSFYGYLGFDMGHFNDYAQANNVTRIGRELIRQIVDWLEERGCRIIEVDTDGLYFTLPEGMGPAAEHDMLEALAATLPAQIRLELAGRYRSMFSYKMKNYALLDAQGKLIIKGSGLRSRGLELFQRQWMEEMLLLLLTGQREKIPELTDRYLKTFDGHRFPVQMFMKTETLQETLDTYLQKVKAKKRNPAAPYELALKSARPYQPGDQISYYVSGQGTKVKVHEAAKLASQWDPDRPDENVEYYKAKLLDLYKKFKPFIEQDGLVPVRADDSSD
ncbi:MAG TPA: DNA polymerase domain-containing protein [Candidatus Methylomirabilis sp.]|nr:DNA polymerase domain-containing protein [Candidatus Methylomirabilis sp.]